MHTTASFARIAGIALLATLLSGCMVHSKMPLMPGSEFPEGIEGTYQVMGAMDARTMRKVPKAQRAECLDPGYTAEPTDLGKKPRRNAKRIRVFYCGFDPEKKEALPVTQIARGADGFRWFDKDNKGAELRLRTVHPDLYLGQLEQGDAQAPRFDYLLLRTRGGDIELLPLFCGDFPSATPDGPLSQLKMGGEAHIEANKAYPLVEECTITSLESIQADLDAFVGKVDAGSVVPLIILHRTPR